MQNIKDSNQQDGKSSNQTKKLSLDAFIAKAKAPNSQELLDKIKGGMMDNCHMSMWSLCPGPYPN